ARGTPDRAARGRPWAARSGPARMPTARLRRPRTGTRRPAAARPGAAPRSCGEHPRAQFRDLVFGAEAPAPVAHHLRQRTPGIVGEEQVHLARQLVLEEFALL